MVILRSRSNTKQGHGQTEVSLKTLADVPFWRMWMYFVVSTSDILTCVPGTMTSVAIGNCDISGEGETVAEMAE